MPNWSQILTEIGSAGSVHDVVRRRYLRELGRVTGRNVIVYYSGWLQKSGLQGVAISDEDKNGFMTVIHEMDRTRGLDLLLHTPGGETAATESLVDYLRASFGSDIRAVVPQLAMSGGTMIACACKEVLMGKHSSLGPIDPQFAGIPAHGVVEEFDRARRVIEENPASIPLWQPIIAKYSPTLIGECEKAIAWSNEMTAEWLRAGMFENQEKAAADEKIERILKELGDHALTKSHARHLSIQRCRDIGLKVAALEDDQELQEAVLSVHHACMLTFSATPAIKLIENDRGVAFIKVLQQVVVSGQPASGGDVDQVPKKEEQGGG
ncbi:MAG: S49 family peptidase [Acidobacteria bacterium]|nr:S49 family peptidase [Acidobacteriota bacterium]